MKVPLTLSSLGDSTLWFISAVDIALLKDLLGHVSADVETTTDTLQDGESDLSELGVVGDLQVVGDLGQLGESEVVEVVVANDGEGLANLSKVGRSKVLEIVVVETERTVELHQRRHADGTAETESHVGGPDQVGKLDLDGLVVVGEGKGIRDVTKLHGNLVDVTVVGDEQVLDLLDVDTLERPEAGVLDADLLRSLNGGSEAEVLEVGESVPLQGVHLLELGEVDGVEAGELVKVHLTLEILEVAR